MSIEEFLKEWNDDSPTILVHTSGSTGQPKPMLVEKRRMEASAHITCRFLGLHEGETALLCLPLDYIAGKMMVVRAQTCQLHLISITPDGHPMATDCGPVDFAAMVPLQVWNSLQDPLQASRIRAIRHLIIGGGAVDANLAAALADFPNAVWSTYGMTETLSHIALRRLNGPERSDWYSPLEGVSVSVNADGCLVINAPAVHEEPLVTNDLAEIDGNRFRILGRKDNVICSGGIKIQIEEVEALLRPHLSMPFMITKIPDTRLGQQMVLLTEDADRGKTEKVCRQVLPRYWQPRQVIYTEKLPLTETGKPARAAAEKLAEKLKN